jgi:hypothetical protein
MNKLTTLTLLAIVTISLAGCCRGWPRLFGRGDSCAPVCGGASYGGNYEGADLGTGPALMAPTIIPQRGTEMLPGPVVQP